MGLPAGLGLVAHTYRTQPCGVNGWNNTTVEEEERRDSTVPLRAVVSSPSFLIFRPEFAAGRHARFCFEVGLDCVRACACVAPGIAKDDDPSMLHTAYACMLTYTHTEWLEKVDSAV